MFLLTHNSILYKVYVNRFPYTAVTVEDKFIVTGSEQEVDCHISGLTGAAAIVTWLDPSNTMIVDGADYGLDSGLLTSGNQTATLTIKLPILEAMTASQTYKCKVQSTYFTTDSPESVNEVTLTPLVLGE